MAFDVGFEIDLAAVGARLAASRPEMFKHKRGATDELGAARQPMRFTRSIARELASFGGNIRINCICPGPMLTPMSGDIYHNDAPKTHAAVPIGRYGTTTEVAAGVLFLLSDEASFVYGEALNVDGGLVMD